MTDIVAFLNARQDEDEAAAIVVAESGFGDTWRVGEPIDPNPDDNFAMDERVDIHCVRPGSGLTSGGALLRPEAEHIARHDPARVLREVKAKRAIVALHPAELVEVINADGDERSGVICTCCDDPFPCGTLKLLAMAHADHPDFQPWWNVAT